MPNQAESTERKLWQPNAVAWVRVDMLPVYGEP